MDDSTVDEPLTSDDDPGGRDAFAASLRDSSWAAMILCAIFGIVAALAFATFVFQVQLRYPSGEWYFPTNKLLVFGHFVRGTCLALLCAKLWRYHAAVKRYVNNPFIGLAELGEEHAAVWQTAAWMLGLIFCYRMASANYLRG